MDPMTLGRPRGFDSVPLTLSLFSCIEITKMPLEQK